MGYSVGAGVIGKYSCTHLIGLYLETCLLNAVHEPSASKALHSTVHDRELNHIHLQYKLTFFSLIFARRPGYASYTISVIKLYGKI